MYSIFLNSARRGRQTQLLPRVSVIASVTLLYHAAFSNNHIAAWQVSVNVQRGAGFPRRIALLSPVPGTSELGTTRD